MKKKMFFLSLILVISIASNFGVSVKAESSEPVRRVLYTQKRYNKTYSKTVSKRVKYTGSSKYVTITANWKIKVSFLYTVNPNTGKIGNFQSPTVSIESPYISNDLGVASLDIENMSLNKNSNGTALKLYVQYSLSASPLAYPRGSQTVTFGPYSITDNNIS